MSATVIDVHDELATAKVGPRQRLRLQELQRAAVSQLRAIAAGLEERGIPAARAIL
jgi:hypothetical protein